MAKKKESEDKLKEKYGLLEIPFPDQLEISRVRLPESDVRNHYVLPELCRLPMFLPSRSAICENSRKIYTEFLKDEVNGIKRVDKKISFNEKDMIFRYEEKERTWEILADYHWGFPNDFDNHIYTFIQSLISEHYRINKVFASIYKTTYADIFKYLKNKGVLSANSDGKNYYQRIRHSFYRLQSTVYNLSTGYNRTPLNGKKEEKECIQNYQFSLLTSLYFDQEKLPGAEGELAGDIAFAIDPLMKCNFDMNYYQIINNSYAKGLLLPNSFFLYSKISQELSIDINHPASKFHIQKSNHVKIFRMYSYNRICSAFGLSIRTGAELKPSKIKSDFKKIHDELIKQGVIETILFEPKADRSDYNIIYVLTDKFVDDIFNILSNEDVNKYREKIKKITPGEVSEYFKSLYSFVRVEENQKYLTNRVI